MDLGAIVEIGLCWLRHFSTVSKGHPCGNILDREDATAMTARADSDNCADLLS